MKFKNNIKNKSHKEKLINLGYLCDDWPVFNNKVMHDKAVEIAAAYFNINTNCFLWFREPEKNGGNRVLFLNRKHITEAERATEEYIRGGIEFMNGFMWGISYVD